MNNVVTRASCQSPSEINTLHFVSDDELLFRTRELARHETELTIVTIQHLDEIERRELYEQRGYSSLFEYAVRELHYSKGCAWRRIMVMKLCRAVPGIADKLRSGELNLTTASQLQNAIEKRARKAARMAARERASEAASVPPAGAASARAEESVSGEVQPGVAGVPGGAGAASGSVWVGVGAAATQAVAGESAAGESAVAVPAAAWAPVGAAAAQAAVGESAAGESAVAVPLPAAAAATGVTAAAILSPAQAGTAGAEPGAAVSAEPGAVPDETEVARVAGRAAVAAPAALAPAAASPTAGAARESATAPPAAEPPPAWTLDQKVELVDLVANKSARETEKLLAELEPEVGLPRERQRALGGGRYEVRVILDQGSVDTIAKLKGWLSHVNPGFTTGQLLAHLLQQAERKYDPMRERGRTKRWAAAPARHAETCEQDLGVNDERQATGSALGVAVSKADSSTCATGAPGTGEGVPATGAARGSVAAGSVAAGAPAPAPAAAGSADAGFPAPAPPAAGPSGALATGSAQTRHRGTQRAAAPASEQDRRDTPGSAQNQRVPVPLVRDRSSDRTPHHAAGSADAGFLMPAPAPSAAGPSAALAGGSAQNRRTQPVAAPSSEQDRRSTTGSAPNQPPPRAGIVGARTKTEPHRAVRARLPAEGTAAPPTAPESARARRTRRHIPAAVRRAVWRKYGGACCYQDPLTGVTCGSTHLLQIDHIVPVAQGGSDDIPNLRLRCAVHNRRRDPRCASYRSAPAPSRGRSRSISTPSNHESS